MTTLTELLTAIPAAAEILLDGLVAAGDYSAIRATRLSCKAFRKFADEHIDELSISVRETDLQRWTNGELPPLDRWPACNSLNLRLYAGSASNSPDLLASMAAVPFLSHAMMARQRLHTIRLQVKPATPQAARIEGNPGAAVQSLASHLPNLRRLYITEACCLSFTPLHQQLMYNSLAALPHLELLHLPCHEALDRVGTLAGKGLRELMVERDHDNYLPLSRQALNGISQLTCLTQLTITAVMLGGGNAGPARRLRALLDSLPASLRKLALKPVCKDESIDSLPVFICDLELQAADGRLRTVAMSTDGTWAARLSLVASALLTCRLMTTAPPDTRLEKLSLGCVCLPRRLAFEAPVHQPLLQLAARCREVDTECLQLDSLDDVWPALEVFGKPCSLMLPACCDDTVPHVAMTYLQLALREAGEPVGWAGPQAQVEQQLEEAHMLVPPLQQQEQHAHQPGHEQRLQQEQGQGQQDNEAAAAPVAGASMVPTVAEVAQRALQVLAGVPSAGAAEAVAGPGPADDSAASSQGQGSAGSSGDYQGSAGPSDSGSPAGAPTDAETDSYSSGLLLLRGGVVRLLSQAPESLTGWLREWLRRRVADTGVGASAGGSSVGGGTGSAGGGVGDQCVPAKSFLMLPAPTDAILLNCGTSGGAAAVVATGVRSAAAGLSAGALDVVPVRRPHRLGAESYEDFARAAYVDALEAVLQEVWDARFCSGAAAALGEKELLRQLVELVRQLDRETLHGMLQSEEYGVEDSDELSMYWNGSDSADVSDVEE